MTIKSKAHQQFYSLFLTFFLVVGLLLLNFYSVLSVKTYQITEQAIQSDLMTALLPQEIKVLLMKLDIIASYTNFYTASITLIFVCALTLIILLFRLNIHWKRTYLSHIDFIHTCIAHHQRAIDDESVNDEALFDQFKYSEQQAIANFFVTLKLPAQNSDAAIHSNTISTSNIDTDIKDDSVEDIDIEYDTAENFDTEVITHQVISNEITNAIDEEADVLDKQPEIFNLLKFTEKQISPEFSVLLIEEYLKENKQLFDNIKSIIKAKHYAESLSDLKQLLGNAKVLSVTNLEVSVEALIIAIEKAQNQKIQPLFIEVEEQILLFIEVFAEVIE